jgi:hypothetical protein
MNNRAKSAGERQLVMPCNRSIVHYSLSLIVVYFIAAFTVVDGALVFQPFDPFLPCADGSPAGIYSNRYDAQSSNLPDQTKHVIVFEGGGACTSPEDCQAENLTEPYKFSSLFLPKEIKGDTILSEEDADENLLQNYTKWLVPYCTQDLFLGDITKGEIGGFVPSGSSVFRGAISHWKREVQKESISKEGSGGVDHLVVAGISAGAIGLLNHVGTVRDAAQEVGVGSVLYILDSPTISDRYDNANFAYAMETYVDLTMHPLCDPANFFSELYNEISDLPCCLSTHCMLRHDKRLSKFLADGEGLEGHASGNETSTSEEIFII